MFGYKKYIILKYRYFIITSLYKYKLNINMYYNYYITAIVANYLYFRYLLRNEILCFINYFMILRLLISINSLIVVSSIYSRFFFNNLFIELAAYYLNLLGWRYINVCIRGFLYNFFYLFRYLYYSYYQYSKRLLNISLIFVSMNEQYGQNTYKKYPKRRRRFKRII